MNDNNLLKINEANVTIWVVLAQDGTTFRVENPLATEVSATSHQARLGLCHRGGVHKATQSLVSSVDAAWVVNAIQPRL